ncbi:MAG: hypothetical protein LBB61_09180 [Treponema sp.]|jgi:hypothetical protein|nr:hypothetical protein [Treponema sp.]
MKYKPFAAEEALQINSKAGNPSPKHGSWCNIVEIKLITKICQCLNQKIDMLENLKNEL